MKRQEKDCLELKGRLGGEEVKLGVIYMRTGNEMDVILANRDKLEKTGRRIREADVKNEPYLFIGDLNGRLGYLGYQEEIWMEE